MCDALEGDSWEDFHQTMKAHFSPYYKESENEMPAYNNAVWERTDSSGHSGIWKWQRRFSAVWKYTIRKQNAVIPAVYRGASRLYLNNKEMIQDNSDQEGIGYE